MTLVSFVVWSRCTQRDVLVLDGGVIVGKHLHDVLDLHRYGPHPIRACHRPLQDQGGSLKFWTARGPRVRQADVTMLLKNAPGAVDDAPLDKSKKKKGPAEDVRVHGA